MRSVVLYDCMRQEPRLCICPSALYARHFLEYLLLRTRDAAKISDRPKCKCANCASLHLLQLSSMIPFLIQVLAGVFVRPNLRNNGVEPSPFYSIPAALWSICCIPSVYIQRDISRLNLTINMEGIERKEACTLGKACVLCRMKLLHFCLFEPRWVFATTTTVGYGDFAPTTSLGQCLGSLTFRHVQGWSSMLKLELSLRCPD